MLYQLSYASEYHTACPTAAAVTARTFPASYSADRAEAGDGARTRDIKLGRLALYQLSYSRDCRTPTLRGMVGEGFEPSKA